MEKVAEEQYPLRLNQRRRMTEGSMNTTFEDSVADATASLKRAQSTLISEIKNYPTPVAGCDLQYNHLLEEKARVTAALQALRTPMFTPTPRQLTA